MPRIYTSSLASTPNHIRLLQIRPGRESEPICCRFLTCSLDASDIPPYQALSYCWGTTASTETIYVGGVEAKITPNLHSAVLQLRSRRQALLLWADAVCINQEDLEEKKVQIEQMRRIYQLADQVVVWLGESTPGARIAMDWLKREDKDAMDEPTYHLWQELMLRPWFTRVWVLQEVAMARKDPVVRCGDDAVLWSDLPPLESMFSLEFCASYLFMLRQFAKQEGVGLDDLACVFIHTQSFLAIVRRIRAGHLLSWKEVFLLCLFMRATDQRDLIYGLLGVLGSQSSPGLRPDYTLDAGCVLRSAAVTALKGPDGLELLTLIAPAKNEQLPSWIPDINNGPVGLFLVPGCEHYSPAGRSRPRLHWSPDLSVMHVEGIAIDIIHEIAINDKDDWTYSRALARKSGSDHGTSEEQVTEWFWRTMCANQGRSGDDERAPVSYPACKELGLEFQASQREIAIPEHIDKRDDLMSFELMRSWRDSAGIFNEHGQSSFFVTESGRFGLGQSGLQRGDVACILSGSRTITLLREHEGYYRFVGCAYVHGLMDGEMASQLEDGSQVRTFDIH